MFCCLILAILHVPEPVPAPKAFRVAGKVRKYEYRRDPFVECVVFKKDGKLVFADREKLVRALGVPQDDATLPTIKDEEFVVFVNKKRAIEVSDGWLYTVDFGEWGGGIYWFSRDWREQERLFDENVNSIIKMKDGFYCLGGLAHLGSQDGYLLKIERNSAGWAVNRVCDLPETPIVYSIVNDREVIFGYRDVWRLDTTGSLQKLFPMPPEIDLPNSMQIQNGIAYIGGHKYIAAVNVRTGKVARWYEPIPPKPD